MKRNEGRKLTEMQADRVEAVLSNRKAFGRVIEITAGPRIIQFGFKAATGTRFSTVEGMADDMALALGVPEVRVSRRADLIVLEFARTDAQPVTFPKLLEEVTPLPPSAMLLGLGADGAPLLARLSAPEVAQILVSGTTGAGKSVLLRTMVLSMALTQRPADLGMIVIDLTGRTFPAAWPHLSRPIITDAKDVLETLRSVAHLMEIRDQRNETEPHIAVVIEELADLIMQVEGATEQITRLAQRGRKAGIHIIGATQHPSAAILSSVMRANFPLRLVGKVVCAADAHMAAGRAGTNAHLLGGRGDFLAVSGGLYRFQVPHVSPEVFASEVNRARTGKGLLLQDAPAEEMVEEISQAEVDAEILLERALQEERRWRSQNEAERWLAGYNGGSATARARAALAVIAQRDKYEKQDQSTTTTTTTPTALARVFAGLKGVTA